MKLLKRTALIIFGIAAFIAACLLGGYAMVELLPIPVTP